MCLSETVSIAMVKKFDCLNNFEEEDISFSAHLFFNDPNYFFLWCDEAKNKVFKSTKESTY